MVTITAKTKGLHAPSIVHKAEVEVVFGTPSRNCEGSGICMVTERFPIGYTVPCPHTRAIIYCDTESRELVFRFPRRHVTEQIERRFFAGSFFVVEEPFPIPLRLRRKWGIEGKCVPQGRYPLECYSVEWRIYFPWPIETDFS